MSVLYIKVLSDYYHHIIGDLEESRKNFLENPSLSVQITILFKYFFNFNIYLMIF